MKINPDEEKDLVWLPKSVATKIKQLENSDNFIQEYIDSSKRDIKSSFDAFDDEILGYRASMLKLKAKFKEAADEAIDANYKVWLEFDKERASLNAKIAQCVAEVQPLVSKVDELKTLIFEIKGYDIERFLDIIEKIKGHLYGEERNIIEFLINNYKKPVEKQNSQL